MFVLSKHFSMEKENQFNNRAGEGDFAGEQFSIEVADGDQGRLFAVRPLGQGRYELSQDGGTIGTLQLDERDHAHCESQGCELDLPLLHAVREQIRFHQQLRG